MYSESKLSNIMYQWIFSQEKGQNVIQLNYINKIGKIYTI